jgi:PAS domain S-box-containing protein
MVQDSDQDRGSKARRGAPRKSEDGIRHVVDAIPAIVWGALPDGSVEFVNDRWIAYTGLRIEDALGEGWKAAIHPEDLGRTVEYWRAMLASGEPANIEHRIRGVDAKYRWFLTRCVPVRNAAGELTRWYGSCTDIEDRKVVEETLRRNQAFFISEAQRIERVLGTPAVASREADEAFLEERRAVDSLTPKERAIIRLIAEGKSNAEVARSVHLSPRTVETYRGRIMRKLQLEDMAALVKLAIRQALTSIQ